MQTTADHANPDVQERVDKTFLTRLAAIIALATTGYVLRAVMMQGFTRAESAFAEGAREMLVNHEMLAPVYQTIPYFDKPPLFYWLTVYTFELFGTSVFTSRLIAIVAAVLTVIATAFFAKHFFGKRVALASAAIVSSTLCFAELASTCMPDMWLTLLEFGFATAIYQIIFSSDKKLTWATAAGLFCGLGWMIKGPVVLVLPGAALVGTMILFKQPLKVSFKQVALAVAVFLAVIMPWHVAIYQKYGFESMNWLYLKGMLGRFLGKHELYNFGHPITYMFTTLMSGFLPWTVALVPGFAWVVQKLIKAREHVTSGAHITSGEQITAPPAMTYLVLWSAITVVFFSLSSSNWGYYNLPVFPALSIITAYFLMALAQKRKQIIPICSAVFYLLTLGSVAYSLILLPQKAAKDEYLSLATDIAPIKKVAPGEQLYCHHDLIGQYILIDHVTFATGRIPGYCSQAELESLLTQAKPADILISQSGYDKLSETARSKVKIVRAITFNFLKFPGCKLAEGDVNAKVARILLIRFAGVK